MKSARIKEAPQRTRFGMSSFGGAGEAWLQGRAKAV